MNISNEIESLIKKALLGLDFSLPEKIEITHPDILDHGDFTTSFCLAEARKLGKNPREFAEQILSVISKNENTYVEKVEIAGPGFLNFYLSKKFFRDFLTRKDEKKKMGQKIVLEHSSPNLFKPFHIGHMVNNAIGESLVRILRYAGNEVLTASFPSDVSPGIAKTIWALKNQNIDIKNLQLQQIADAYVLGSREYKENESVKKEVDIINAELYGYINGSGIFTENTDFYESGKNLSLEHFLEITKKLGSDFDQIFYESEAENKGKKLVNNYIETVFEKSDGAVIFEGKNFTNVFVNSQGFGTYLAKDLGLLELKKENFSAIEKSLVVTDVEQKQHFEMVKEAAVKISEISEFADKSSYLQHGRMTFSGNTKISSRYGNVPLATELIEIVQRNILYKMKERDFSDDEKNEISEILAIATLKYSIVKVTSGKNITFDIEKDTNPQGNSATYLMYSLVRAKSILSNIKISEEDFDIKRGEVSDLEKILYRIDEKVERTLEDYSPHHIANFAYDLTVEFNKFYAETKVLDSDNSDYLYNLKLVKVYRDKMEEIFNLLGIKTVEKM